MVHLTNNTDYIIVLGTTYSGSGAVYDYLAGRGDLYDPLLGTEYQLPQMPNGLMALEAVAGNAFHPSTTDFVISQFKEVSKKLSQPRKIWQYGKNYSSMLPFFEIAINQFLEEISAAKFPMNLHWHRLMQPKTPLIYFFYKLKNYLNFNNQTPQTRIIVSQEKFVVAAQKLHNELFKKNSINKPVLLNQAGSGWNPVESTKFFKNRKVILVTRDPRDQFSSLKNRKKATNVEGFINWYKELQKRIKKFENSIILKLKFEDFVNNNKKIVDNICRHISLDSKKLSNYDPNISKKNIGNFKKNLNQKEINTIENELSEYLY